MIAQLSLEDILVMPMRVCEYCGVDISHKQLTARYCCRLHKNRVWNTTHREEKRIWDATHKEKRTAWSSAQYKKQVVLANKLLPNVCFFGGGMCGTRKNNSNLILHEKSGTGHDRTAVHLIYSEPNRASEFVRLCYKHHSMVHSLMDMGLTWDKIAGLI